MTEQWPADVRRALGPPPVVEPTARWVRVELAGQPVADSRRALLLIEYGPGRLPTYYFPQEDVRLDALEPLPAEGASGERAYFRAPGDAAPGRRAAWIVQNPPPGLEALRGYVSFTWDAPATWYEEAERVVAHARDPHHRVDALASSRHVQVLIAGETVADTRAPVLLFETHLPTRYYIPPQDVRLDLLAPSDLTTICPYKGVATYHHANVGDRSVKNVVWSYQDPIPECPRIRGLLAFYNERVDLRVDGESQARPRTPWSE
jgi:uncharacterized protein (DUF427 family)